MVWHKTAGYTFNKEDKVKKEWKIGGEGRCFFKISAHAFMTSERELSILLSLSQTDKKQKKKNK